jgi:DNA-directed RNA polymerase specialized sigma24 family protein
LAAQTLENDMRVIPHQWREYLARQVELDQRDDTTSTTWGMEAGLNDLLDHAAGAQSAARAAAAEARRSRYAQALTAKYVNFESYRGDGVVAMEARSTLRKISDGLPADTVRLLFEAACGAAPHKMAVNLGLSTGAYQTRLSRARAAARKLAA